MDCHRNHKENAILVPKASLGVTSPHSMHELVNVCDGCAHEYGGGATGGDTCAAGAAAAEPTSA